MQFYRCVYLATDCDIPCRMGAPLYVITGSNISFISLCSRIDNTFGYTHKMPEEIRNTMQKRPFEVNVSEVPA